MSRYKWNLLSFKYVYVYFCSCRSGRTRQYVLFVDSNHMGAQITLRLLLEALVMEKIRIK